MKTMLAFVLSTAVQIAVVASSGYPLDAASVLSIVFVSGLMTWAFQEFNPKPRFSRAPRRAAAAQDIRKPATDTTIAAASAPVPLASALLKS